MELEKSLVSGSMSLLVLKLLEDGDLYGYQMIAELRRRSDDTFRLKAGTLYPLLHSLEEKGFVTAYEQTAESGKTRRYYHLTKQGRSALQEKETAWNTYARIEPCRSVRPSPPIWRRCRGRFAGSGPVPCWSGSWSGTWRTSETIS